MHLRVNDGLEGLPTQTFPPSPPRGLWEGEDSIVAWNQGRKDPTVRGRTKGHGGSLEDVLTTGLEGAPLGIGRRMGDVHNTGKRGYDADPEFSTRRFNLRSSRRSLRFQS